MHTAYLVHFTTAPTFIELRIFCPCVDFTEKYLRVIVKVTFVQKIIFIFSFTDSHFFDSRIRDHRKNVQMSSSYNVTKCN
jgi:hypothetical protein